MCLFISKWPFGKRKRCWIQVGPSTPQKYQIIFGTFWTNDRNPITNGLLVKLAYSVCWETCEIFCVFFRVPPKKKKQSKNEAIREAPSTTSSKNPPHGCSTLPLALASSKFTTKAILSELDATVCWKGHYDYTLPPMNMETESGSCWKVTTIGGLWEEEYIKPCLFSVQEPFNSKRLNKGLKGSRKGHKETLQKNSENLQFRIHPSFLSFNLIGMDQGFWERIDGFFKERFKNPMDC